MHAEAIARPGVLLVAAAVALVTAPGCSAAGRAGARPTEPDTIATAPEATVPESAWAAGRMNVAYPDALALIDGAVFVKTDDGRVVKVDPGTRRVTADVKVDTTSDSDHYCQGIGTDGSTLWACSAADGGATDVVGLDPRTLEVRARVAVGKLFDQLAIPVVAGRAWVLTGGGASVTAVDTSTTGTRTHDLGRPCLEVAATTTTVYATCQLSDEVIALDTRTGKVEHRASVAGAFNVAADDADVWVSGSHGLVRFSPALEPRARYPGLVAGRDGDLLLTDESLWVRQGDDFVTRIDRATGSVQTHYAADDPTSGGSLLAVGEEIWASASNDDALIVIDTRPCRADGTCARTAAP